ncbi:MAG: hypothetical protein Q7U04_02090 [Bacteriovorax sp.]|nr:hypothetical protein [Bacteriovorax sp.]
MKFPDVQDYDNYRVYLEDFYKLNKKENSPISHRYIAQKLKWPISYFNEVLKKRKNLTLPRALEFAKFAKMDLVDAERLIYLIFLESDNLDVQDYFKKKLHLEANTTSYYDTNSRKMPQLPENYFVMPEEIHNDASLIALHELIKWSHGEMGPKDLAKMLYTFPELEDERVLSDKLKLLEMHKIIEILELGQPKKFNYITNLLYSDIHNKSIGLYVQHAENFLRFTKLTRKMGFLQAGTFNIPRSRLLEAEKRIILLSNWLNSVQLEAEELSKDDRRNDSLIFQFEAKLISILNPTVLKIASFSDWITKK